MREFVFSSGELEREAVVAKNATTAADGKTYQIEQAVGLLGTGELNRLLFSIRDPAFPRTITPWGWTWRLQSVPEGFEYLLA